MSNTKPITFNDIELAEVLVVYRGEIYPLVPTPGHERDAEMDIESVLKILLDHHEIPVTPVDDLKQTIQEVMNDDEL